MEKVNKESIQIKKNIILEGILRCVDFQLYLVFQYILDILGLYTVGLILPLLLVERLKLT